MGKGDHMEVVSACARELGDAGIKQVIHWKKIGACHRCGSTRFRKTPGGVKCSVCYPPPGTKIKSWTGKPSHPVIVDG